MSKGNYFENQFKVVGMHNGEEIIEVKGVAIDWGDGAEEIYFYHPITGQKINEARKLLQGLEASKPRDGRVVVSVYRQIREFRWRTFF